MPKARGGTACCGARRRRLLVRRGMTLAVSYFAMASWRYSDSRSAGVISPTGDRVVDGEAELDGAHCVRMARGVAGGPHRLLVARGEYVGQVSTGKRSASIVANTARVVGVVAAAPTTSVSATAADVQTIGIVGTRGAGETRPVLTRGIDRRRAPRRPLYGIPGGAPLLHRGSFGSRTAPLRLVEVLGVAVAAAARPRRRVQDDPRWRMRPSRSRSSRRWRADGGIAEVHF